MRMKTVTVLASLVAAASLAWPPVATGAPTLALEPDCSLYPPLSGVAVRLSGLPPNTTFTGTLTLPGGTSFGPLPFVTDEAGNFTFGPGGFGISADSGIWTLEVVWSGGTIIQSVNVNCAMPTSKDQCKNGGWQAYGIFKNQGDCVSFVVTGGKNPPAG